MQKINHTPKKQIADEPKKSQDDTDRFVLELVGEFYEKSRHKQLIKSLADLYLRKFGEYPFAKQTQ
tara:strand:- start:232 stop:429 length:198 start_codon:yes stop_codon:yes gene_type:complete